MSPHLGAILWAQYRALLNFRPREGRTGFALAALMAVGWYGLWAAMAVAVQAFVSSPLARGSLNNILPRTLMLMFIYWQLAPVMTASLGASLELKKLLVYPIPFRQLFTIEVLLRLSTSIEMMIVLAGLAIGLARNPAVPAWAAPAALVPFVAFNLFVSAGLRQWLERLLARKRLREALILLLVVAVALPQLLLVTGLPPWLGRLFSGAPLLAWPWAVTGRVALGGRAPLDWALLGVWLAAAWWFGRWQFARSLRFDGAAESASGPVSAAPSSWTDSLWRWPSALFSDPLAGVLEKELRTLVRTPRFRLIFLMGFTFGPLIWLPVAFGRGAHTDSLFATNYLSFVSAYALLLLGDVTFWNTLGLDRSAAVFYYLWPAPLSKVLAAKNLAALFFVVAEITAVMLICFALRMPFTPLKIVEAYAVTLALSVFLLAMGNLSSVYYPMRVSSDESWRTTSPARFRALLLVLYPLAATPVMLAYLARYAFASEIAFYAVLLFAVALGAVFYWIAMESALAAADLRKEKILAALGEAGGPMGA